MSSFAETTPDFEEEFEQDEVDRAIEQHGISGADLDQMASLEKDMDEAQVEPEYVRPANTSPKASSGAFLPPGAMPTTKTGALGTHANEFWFPECRNCPCCKGFKHGCKCRTGITLACTDPNCMTNAGAAVESAVEEKPRHKSVITFKAKPVAAAPPSAPAAAAAPAPAPAPAAASAPAAAPRVAPASIDVSGGGVDPRLPCTFHASPRGCQYGAQCRFKHEGPPGVGGGGGGPSPTYTGSMPPHMTGQSGLSSPAGAGSPDAICRFFAAGNCRSGASCRFSHGGNTHS